MDVGKFKSSRSRLILWVMIPAVLIAGVGLSTYALRMQSEWKLTRAQHLAEVFPRLVQARERAEALQQRFESGNAAHIDSEDELISYVQERALKVGFTVDSLKVERLDAADGKLPALTAIVKGSADLGTIYRLLSDVASVQQLLSESELQISRQADPRNPGLYRAEIRFELILFRMETVEGRS
ncbi:hypothetical protein P4B35_10665 [Pontiellaceae bacterium B12227]|nr:hypothetical protein [Pontiellaceae bacterium B12227]